MKATVFYFTITAHLVGHLMPSVMLLVWAAILDLAQICSSVVGIILTMMRSVFTSIALSSVFLTTGVLELSANAQSLTSILKLLPQFPQTSASPTSIAQSTTTLATIEQAIHTQVNQYRASRGLSPLSLDSRISQQARIHSQNMASGTVPFSHEGFSQRVQAIATVIAYSGAAENVAYNQGYADPATQAVQGWLKSTGHRQNIEGQYNLTGIGVAKNAKGEYYFTQIFIRAANSSSQVSSPSTSTTAPTSSTQSTNSLVSLEQAVHDQVNQYRASRGLPALALDSRISQQARTHSQNMASGTVPFSHEGFDQRVEAIATVIPYSGAAENVAYNQSYADPATQAVQGWLKSTGHRTNIEGNYNLTGIGIAKNARGEYYFTQIFIRNR